jgi:hypothetical protein
VGDKPGHDELRRSSTKQKRRSGNPSRRFHFKNY